MNWRAGFQPGWFDGNHLFLIITGQLVLRKIHYSEFIYTASIVTVPVRYFNLGVEWFILFIWIYLLSLFTSFMSKCTGQDIISRYNIDVQTNETGTTLPSRWRSKNKRRTKEKTRITSKKKRKGVWSKIMPRLRMRWKTKRKSYRKRIMKTLNRSCRVLRTQRKNRIRSMSMKKRRSRKLKTKEKKRMPRKLVKAEWEQLWRNKEQNEGKGIGRGWRRRRERKVKNDRVIHCTTPWSGVEGLKFPAPLNSALGRGRWSASLPRLFAPWERNIDTHSIDGGVSVRAGLDKVLYQRPIRKLNLDSPVVHHLTQSVQRQIRKGVPTSYCSSET
jgi:hypothetical protein